MKKICAFVITLMTTTAYAEDLKCEQNYDLFKKNYLQNLTIMNTGTLDQFEKFNAANDYTVSVTSASPDQDIYYLGEWYSPKKYEEMLSSILEMAQISPAKNTYYTLAKPKANYMSSIGEVCVVPTQSEDSMFGQKITSKTDQIFVRNLKTNQWTAFSYSGIEDKSDMNKFFPDLSNKVKLTQMIMNDKNYADSMVESTVGLLKEMGMEVNEAAIKEIKKEIKYDRLKLKLKENGHL